MVALRLTPGAYTYCGAVVQQMQLRADAAIEAMLREGGSPPKGVREAHPELASMLGPNGLNCLLYTSDAADERSSADPRGRRNIKKKTQHNYPPPLPYSLLPLPQPTFSSSPSLAGSHSPNCIAIRSTPQ